MSEKRRRLARWLSGEGIEIGALHEPLELPASAHVRYVDHLPVDKLREHYPELRDLPLVPVDVIATAEDLGAFGDGSLDFVIANHLFEHLEYPVQALLEFQRVLRPGGVLYLALPDQRRTFDRGRALTSAEHLVEEQRDHRAEENRRAHYLEWVRAAGDPDPETAADALLASHYSIHFHVWRPDTFWDFLSVVRREFPIALQPIQFAAAEDPGDVEFIVLLAKPDGDRPVLPARAGVLRGAGVRDALRRTPLGPPLRAAKRRLRPRLRH